MHCEYDGAARLDSFSSHSSARRSLDRLAVGEALIGSARWPDGDACMTRRVSVPSQYHGGKFNVGAEMFESGLCWIGHWTGVARGLAQKGAQGPSMKSNGAMRRAIRRQRAFESRRRAWRRGDS